MGLVAREHKDPLMEAYRRIKELEKQVARLRAKSLTVNQISGTGADVMFHDGDGQIWVDVDDHTLHYVVNGTEYKLTGV